jgi:hypothetical protein
MLPYSLELQTHVMQTDSHISGNMVLHFPHQMVHENHADGNYKYTQPQREKGKGNAWPKSMHCLLELIMLHCNIKDCPWILENMIQSRSKKVYCYHTSQVEGG